MRIAHLSLDGNLPRYGIGLAVVRLAEAAAALGDEVTLLCREANARDVAASPRLRVVGLSRVRGWPLRGRRGYVRQVRAALGDGADAIHVHGLTRLAHWLLSRRARGGAPLVVTCHAADEIGPSASPAGEAPAPRARRHARQARSVLARADAVVAPSRWMAERVRALCARAEVHAIGLGPTDETPAPRVAHDGFVVLALARFVPVKGLDVLLDAFALAFSGDPGARLVLAGDGPIRADLEARARAAGLAERVRFPGYVEGAARRSLLGGADVVVVPTRGEYETFGLAALDASAAGVPIVVADTGALPERVEGGAGVTVPPGDPHSLAQALARLREDPQGLRRMGAAGLRTSSESTWERVATAHRKLYEGLVRRDSLTHESATG